MTNHFPNSFPTITEGHSHTTMNDNQEPVVRPDSELTLGATTNCKLPCQIAFEPAAGDGWHSGVAVFSVAVRRCTSQ